MSEQIKDEEMLEEAAGGKKKKGKWRYNNLCPKCGANVGFSQELPVEGMGMTDVYTCRACNLSWIGEEGRRTNFGYNMVGTVLVNHEYYPKLGPYQGPIKDWGQ